MNNNVYGAMLDLCDIATLYLFLQSILEISRLVKVKLQFLSASAGIAEVERTCNQAQNPSL